MTPSASWTPVVNASSTPEEVSTFVEPEPSPMRAKPSPARTRLAAPARLEDRLRAPGAELRVLEPAPEVRVLHVVLQVAVRSSAPATRTSSARRSRPTRRGPGGRRGTRRSPAPGSRACGAPCPAGAACPRAGPRRTSCRPPSRAGRARSGMPMLVVELAAHRADRPVRHDGERRVDVHARHVRALGAAVRDRRPGRGAARPSPCLSSTSACATGVAGPDLDGARGEHLRAHPLHELAHREDEAVLLVQELGRPGQLERVLLDVAARSRIARIARVRGAERRRSGGSRRPDRGGRGPSPRRTGAAIGICAGSRSGKTPRMPRARVTTPDTPKPRSSARS